MTAPDQALDRRAVLHILAALGFGGAVAADLAAQARPTATRSVLQQAASLLHGTFDDRRLDVAERAVQRNLELAAAVRDLDLDDAIEPATIFAVPR